MYNEDLICELGRKVKKGELTWQKATEEYNRKTNDNRTMSAVRQKYMALGDNYTPNQQEQQIDSESHFADGTITLEKTFTSKNNNLTQNDILEMYGYKVNEWEILNWTFNKWGKDGELNYQFKCKLRPKQHLTIQDTIDIAKELVESNITPFKVESVKKDKVLNDDRGIFCNIVDLHIDRRCYASATGVDYNIEKSEEIFNKIIDGLIKWQEVERVGHLFYTIGNDFFNYDNVNGTTSKGTPLVDANYRDMYKKGLELQIKALKTFKKYFNQIHCFLVAGNHDEILDYTLYLHLQQMFSEDRQYIFDEDYKKVKAFMFGDNAIFLSHGDIPAKKLTNALPDMFPKLWGDSKYRYYFQGHYHSNIEDKKSMPGLKRIQQDTMIPTDMYEYNGGYINTIKEQELYEFDKKDGEIGTRILR